MAPLLDDAAAMRPLPSMAIMEMVSWLWGLGHEGCTAQAEVPAAGSLGLYGPQCLAGSGLTLRLKFGWQACSCLYSAHGQPVRKLACSIDERQCALPHVMPKA